MTSRNVLFKDTIRTIGKSASRFFSIVLIVALGISFFAGFSATAPFMREAISGYYKATNTADIRIISPIGLSKSDVKTLASINGISGASGQYFIDGITSVDGAPVTDIDGSALTVRVYGFDVNSAVTQSNPNAMNVPQLLEGQWPAKANECLVDRSELSTPKEFKIGSVIKVSGEDSDITGSLANEEYTIVGIIRTPLYVSYERGHTNIGTGKLGTFVYIPDENFKTDYYSAIDLKIDGADKYEPYTDAYDNAVAPYIEYIKSISTERATQRANKLKGEYAKKVADAEIEFATTKADIEAKIADGEAQVAEIKDMAVNGDEKLQQYKIEYNEKAQQVSQQVSASKLEHSEGYAEYEKRLAEYENAKAIVQKYSSAELTYRTSVSEYNVANTAVTTLSSTVDYLESLVATTRSAVDQVNSNQDTSVESIIQRFTESGLTGVEIQSIVNQINSLTAVGTAEEMSAYLEPELQTLETQLASTKKQLADAKTTLAEKKVQLEKAKILVEKLKETEAKLVTAQGDLETARKKLESAGYDIQLGELEALTQLSDAKNQISNYETAVAMAKEKVATVDEDFAALKKEALDKLAKAENSLKDAKNFLLALDDPKWTVGTRGEMLEGYDYYDQACDRTAALALIFPWFFFLVAALVSLNTMTRMIDDERTQLGTLKALGLRDTEIMNKYLFYAFIASGIGAVSGSFIGFAVFPLMVSSAYGIFFDVPSITVSYNYLYAGIGIVISIGATVLSTYVAAKRSLKIHPSILMKPKAPKAGKRIPLEKITWLWSRLSFNSKVTFRNVFRNKKRFLMAVLGVMGCTALMVSGFGLRNSSNSVIKEQFTDADSIWCYDMQIVLNGYVDLSNGETEVEKIIKQKPLIGNYMHEYMKVFDTMNTKGEEATETYILVPQAPESIENYIRVRSQDGEQITLPDDGAVITTKLAQLLDISVGDMIIVKTQKDNYLSIPVRAIAENYCFHYLYLSPNAYKAFFGTIPFYNYIAANFATEPTAEQKNELSTDLLGEYDISAVSYSSEIQDMLSNTLDSVNTIVVILVISAALLSLIVMYNLSVLNINERKREIASIKVLGFNRRETRNYIFRENILLSALGTLFGLGLGVLSHRIIIKVAEVDIVRYGQSAGIWSFVFASVLSMVFCFVVNLILTRNIKAVDMVDSLKSNE